MKMLYAVGTHRGNRILSDVFNLVESWPGCSMGFFIYHLAESVCRMRLSEKEGGFLRISFSIAAVTYVVLMLQLK